MVQVTIRSTEELLRARGIEKGGRVQKYIDSTVVRLCDKYCPFLNGILKRAIGTVYGSGYVRYSVPYAANQYYNNKGAGREGITKGGLRGRFWFERMKAVHREEILEGAARLAGARARRR